MSTQHFAHVGAFRCAFRYPGRLLRPGDPIPEPAVNFVAEQLRLGSNVLASYAARAQTRRKQFDALPEQFNFRMDWLEQPQLRRQATMELNKGEARNALARAVCFHRLGQLRDRAVEAQQHRASGLTLVTAAIALWNMVYLGRALDTLRTAGEVIPDALVGSLGTSGLATHQSHRRLPLGCRRHAGF